MLKANEEAFIIKKDGTEIGPYKAKFAGTTVVINDPSANVEDGDKVFRLLPNGNREIKHIDTCSFFNTQIGTFGPHFQLKVRALPSESTKSSTTQHISITGGNVQIGNHNRMEFHNSIHTVIEMIENSESSEDEKQQAKSLLKGFLEHPLVISIAGAAISSLI